MPTYPSSDVVIEADTANAAPAPRDDGRELRLFVIAGENSGDIHGANLFRALTEMYPNYKAIGLGGNQLKSVGVKLLRNIVDELAIIGFIAVLANFKTLYRLFYDTVDALKKFKPDALILIDYPGFNIRIARKAKELGIPVIWYISPQIWAWHKDRLYTLAKVVDKMLVIFPFEVSLYREEKVDVVHVGHPLFDVIKIDRTREQVCEEFGLKADKPIICIIPGSRKKEVSGFLPIMLDGAQRYQEMAPGAQFVIIRASTIDRSLIDGFIAKADIDFDPVVVDRQRYNIRAASDFSWVKSGTSTLEAAIMGTPMLIVYRVNYMTWELGKRLFTIGHIGLPNIVAGDRIVPELLQDEFTPRNLAEKTHHYLTNPEAYQRMVNDLQEVRARLGSEGAAVNAAKQVLEVCHVQPQSAT